jgi:dolichol kinase
MHIVNKAPILGSLVFLIGVVAGIVLIMQFDQVLCGTVVTAVSFILACIVLFRTIRIEDSSTLP